MCTRLGCACLRAPPPRLVVDAVLCGPVSDELLWRGAECLNLRADRVSVMASIAFRAAVLCSLLVCAQGRVCGPVVVLRVDVKRPRAMLFGNQSLL